MRKSTKAPQLISSIIFLCAGAASGFAQQTSAPIENSTPSAMPIYITPYYNSHGPEISVGAHSKKFTTADPDTILQIASDLKKEKEKLRPEVMYVIAIRLYDFGKKDEAVYWFYTAQYRAGVFGSILAEEKIGSIGSEAFELRNAYSSFNQLAGTYINGYAFGDIVALEKTLTKVIEEGKELPKYSELFPGIVFQPESEWDQKIKDRSAKLSGLIDYIKKNADYIKEQRKKNGIEGKY
jgi:hypothetical protein